MISLVADFLNMDEIYEDVLDFPKLKQHMEKTLVDYNEYPGQVPMDLVLFRDAIEHGLFWKTFWSVCLNLGFSVVWI